MSEKPTWYQRSVAKRSERATTLRHDAEILAKRGGVANRIASLSNRLEAWRIAPGKGDAEFADRLADRNAQSRDRFHDQILAGQGKLTSALGEQSVQGNVDVQLGTHVASTSSPDQLHPSQQPPAEAPKH